MKMCKSKMMKLTACLLAVLLLVQTAGPLALAGDPKTITIETAEEWAELAESCRLDAWSDGVTVELAADLTLPENSVIPTFGGTLNGNGHTLSGLQLTGEGDHQGLFRYLRQGAVVRDLTVSGTVTPGGKVSVVGGLVGSNGGTVQNCRFQGRVSGKGTVGGLVGLNEVTGQVLDCEFVSGTVSGEHFTGGITGENQGAVIHCTNRGQINTQAVELTPQLEDVDLTQLNRTETIPSCTDTGGIAGFSGGLLQSCSNFGLVGYPHMGYNVGGVAGRQSGQIVDCVNSGSIRGRKDVGGVVGQAEPFLELRYQEDTLQQLASQLDGLSGILQDALHSTDGTRHSISNHLSNISGHTGTAQDHISDLLDDLENVGDETVDVVNDLGSRVRMFMEDLPGMTAELEDAADALTEALEDLERAMGHAGELSEQAEAAAEGLEEAVELLREAIRTLLAGVPVPLGFGMTIAEILHALDLLEAMIREIPDSADKAREAFEQLRDALGQMEGSSGTFETTLRKLESAMGKLSHGSDHLSDAFRALRDAVERQNELPDLELPRLPAEFHESEDALRQTLTALNTELEQMNQTMNTGGDDLSGQLQRVNRQFRSITDVLRRAGQPDEDQELLVDLSEEDLNQSAGGRLQDCRNTGTVEGDVNVGGVAGSMAIEFDFDPEDDVLEKGSKSLRFQYLTKAVTTHCTNRGAVTARKDCVGGIVGRMDMGVIWGGQNYGSVESTGGQEVGGIAGGSDGVIRSSWSKCALTGSRYVGGIAGRGMDLRDCAALVELRDTVSYGGAIAGDAEGELLNNVFLSDTLGGVDGISYQGKAAPLSREAFLALPGLPVEFTRLNVRFIADKQTVKCLSVPYGSIIPAGEVPEVPAIEGYYGAWTKPVDQPVCFDLEIPAEYTPWLTAVTSEDGTVLAEGLFRPETVLKTSGKVESLPEGETVLAQYHVTLPEHGEPMTALRVKLPEEVRRAAMWVLEDGVWHQLPSTLEGSYVRIPWTGTEAQVCLAKAGPSGAMVSLGAGGLVLAGGVIYLLLRKKRKASAS